MTIDDQMNALVDFLWFRLSCSGWSHTVVRNHYRWPPSINRYSDSVICVCNLNIMYMNSASCLYAKLPLVTKHKMSRGNKSEAWLNSGSVSKSFIPDKIYRFTSLYIKFSAVKKGWISIWIARFSSWLALTLGIIVHSHIRRSLDPHGLLLVHVGEHEADVGGQQVVHLVAQRGLAQQLGPTHQVAWTIHRTEWKIS